MHVPYLTLTEPCSDAIVQSKKTWKSGQVCQPRNIFVAFFLWCINAFLEVRPVARAKSKDCSCLLLFVCGSSLTRLSPSPAFSASDRISHVVAHVVCHRVNVGETDFGYITLRDQQLHPPSSPPS